MERIDQKQIELAARCVAAGLVRGARIICNGYPGTITKVCDGQLTGMYEVRVPGGIVCVGGSDLLLENGSLVSA